MKKSALVLVAALASVSAVAQANGRFPESNQIFFSPSDPDFVGMRVTFGLLVSHDRGSTWGWACEPSVGSLGVEDPMWAVTPNKTLMATTFQGITISPDEACSFSFFTSPDIPAQTLFIDLTSNPNDGKDVIFFNSAYDKTLDGAILFHSQLFETKDEGKTIMPLGSAFDPSLFGYTVDVTKTDPNRIYTTFVADPGTTTPKGFLLTSNDHGTTYDSVAVPFADKERGLYIAGVDPTNADRIYLRTLNAADQPSRLIVSEDGGKTFTTRYTSKGALTAFALTPDGQKVYVGGVSDGVLVANVADFQFVQQTATEVQCLTVHDGLLWACSSERGGFVAGVSSDEGKTFQAKLHFCDITGPLACAPGTTTADKCGGQVWPLQQQSLGCIDGGVDAGDASAPNVDAGSDAGGVDQLEAGGCACNLPSGSAPPLAALGLAGAVVALVRRRRR